MSVIRQRGRKGSGAQVGPLAQLAGESLSSADLVLLCSFGPDLNHPRDERALQHSLLLAGYGGPLGRHLIRTSRLLQRCAGNTYVMRRFQT